MSTYTLMVGLKNGFFSKVTVDAQDEINARRTAIHLFMAENFIVEKIALLEVSHD